jgi:hypothetical protein
MFWCVTISSCAKLMVDISARHLRDETGRKLEQPNEKPRLNQLLIMTPIAAEPMHDGRMASRDPGLTHVHRLW